MNKYFKAILMTAVLMALGFAAVNMYDDTRYKGVLEKLESESVDVEAAQQLLFYESVYGSTGQVCAAIQRSVELQVQKNIGLLGELEAAKKQTLFSSVETAKKKFIVQNLQFFLLLEKARGECGSSGVLAILYFYPDKYYCEDCAVQAAALDTLVKDCQEVRVFALPTDLEVPVIEVLKERHSIQNTPSIVIDGKKYEGIVPPAELRQITGCSAAGK